jgi:hypothetical protein
MSELANNIHGEPFEVPAEATAWRVRRMKPKGAPEVVYGSDGLPLLLPIEAGIEEFRAEVNTPGRYRLDPVKEDQRPMPEAPAAYLYLYPQRELRNGDGGAVANSSVDLHPIFTGLLQANLDMGTANANLTRTVIEGFSGVMEAASSMMRAAGSLPLPIAPPAPAAEPAPLLEGGAMEEDDDDGEYSEPAAPALDLQAMGVSLLTSLLTGICNGQIKLPSLGALVGRRAVSEAPAPRHVVFPPVEAERSAPSPTPAPTPREQSAPARTAASPSPNFAALMGSLPPMAMMQLMAVQQALTPQERASAVELLRELSPTELLGWAKELSLVPVDEAVAKVRATLRGGGGEDVKEAAA